LEILRTRTGSPSVHSCPASDGAANFFLASALRHHQPLRAAGEKDARCVQPTSATQTNCEYPHLVCSRLTLATFAAGTPLGVLGSERHDRGNRAFHDARRPLRRIAMQHVPHDGYASRLGHERGRCSSHGADAIEPLTPLSRSDVFHPPPPSLSRGLHRRRALGFWPWYPGRRMRLSAEDHP
jgi:hypothetical protein